MPTTVVNLKTYKRRDGVYIGRANHRYGFEQSKWANLHKLRGRTRKEILALYEQDLRHEYEKTHELWLAVDFLYADLSELRGKVLMCWCDPKPCHGHLLARLADMTLEELRDWWKHGFPNEESDDAAEQLSLF